MSESPNQTVVGASPAPGPQPSPIGTGRSLPAWLGRTVPPLLMFTALGGLLLGGHHTGWTIPNFSSLAGPAEDEKDDWCSEHCVPESQCVECNPALLPRPKAFGWCKKHGVHECPLCHPEVAETTRPQITAADLARAKSARRFCGPARKQQQVQVARTPHPVHIPGSCPEGRHRSRTGLEGSGDRSRHGKR